MWPLIQVWIPALCPVQLGWSFTKLKQREHLILTPGENAEMICEQDGADQQMYWYRQRGGQEMQLILFSRMENLNIEKELSDARFSGNRTERKTFILGIRNNASGVYFCAASLHCD
uniref:Ig-like domain-containing protein n=1 Tax=Erpetoichthys calabaricus TaxID=27687 RepID=A0A8C4TGN1_ERPCA